jgi:hypothetical protein
MGYVKEVSVVEVGNRRRRLGAGRTVIEEELRPDAQSWGQGYATWQGKLGVAAGKGWVRVYGQGLNYPYVAEGRVVGGPNP